MVDVTNLTGGVITVGENEFIILPSNTIGVPNDRYEILKSEFLALESADQILVNTQGGVPSYLLNKTRTQITGAGATYTAAQVLGGVIHRVTTGVVVDHLPTAAELIAAMPGCIVGSAFELAISNDITSPGPALVQAGTGMSFIDDWAIAGDMMNVYPRNVNHILFWVTDIATPTIKAKILSLGGFMDGDYVLPGMVLGNVGGTPWLGPTRGIETHAPVAPSPFPHLQFEERHRIKIVVIHSESGVGPFDGVQFSAADLLGGFIIRTATGWDYLDRFPNPADLVAAIPGCEVGSFVDFTILNPDAGLPGGSNGWTMYYSFVQPTGVTLNNDGLMIGFGQYYTLRALITDIGTGTEAYTVYLLSGPGRPRSLDTFLHSGLMLIGGADNTAQETAMLTKRGVIKGFGGPGGYLFADNGGGGTRCNSYNHGLPDGSAIKIYECGEPAYNGNWVITVIDANTFDIATAFVSDPAPGHGGSWFWFPVQYTDVGDISYPASHLASGLILRDPNGADRSDTLPSAADLTSWLPGYCLGFAFEFTIQNIANAVEKITLVAGAGITLAPVPGAALEILQGQTRKFMLVFTNVDSGSEAATVYGLY